MEISTTQNVTRLQSADRQTWRKSSVIAIAGSLILLPLIGYFDAWDGPDFSWAFCYVVPVLITTWFAGRRAGFLMAGIAVIAWHFSEKNGAYLYIVPGMAYWNAAWRLIVMCLAAAQLWAFRDLRDHLETTVEARTNALRRLAMQLLESEDRERQRLAYDIHDDFGQILTTLKLNISTPLPESSEGSVPRRRRDDAITMIDDLIGRSRKLIFDLHPAMLDQFGLVPTLRRHAEQFAGRANVEVLISEEGNPRPLSDRIANYLFRSVKELLNNAVKHGHAKQIIARFFWEENGIRVVVDDDGGGFDTADLAVPDIQRGLGLAGIRERLTSLGGNLKLESTGGEGTRVMMELPWVRKEMAA